MWYYFVLSIYLRLILLLLQVTYHPATNAFLGAFANLRKATISFVMSVCLSISASVWNNSAPTSRIFVKFNIWVFFENISRKFKFYCNLTRITGTLHDDLCTFMIISPWILIRIRNVSDTSCGENHYTCFMCNNIFPKIVPFMTQCGKIW
jgi:hypothetical protein